MRDAVDRYGRVPLRDEVWSGFVEGLRYAHVDFDAANGFAELKRRVDEADSERGTEGTRIFSLSVPPSAIGPYADRLGAEGMSHHSGDGFVRLIVEKPFGRDMRTGRALNEQLHRSFDESQIYRIDHY